MPLTPPPGVVARRSRGADTSRRLPVPDSDYPAPSIPLVAESAASGPDPAELLAEIQLLRSIIEHYKFEQAEGRAGCGRAGDERSITDDKSNLTG